MHEVIVFSAGVGASAVVVQMLALVAVYRKDVLFSLPFAVAIVFSVFFLLWLGIFSPFSSIAWSMYDIYFSSFCG